MQVTKINSINFGAISRKSFLKPHFYTWVSWKTNSKNAKSQFEQAKIPPENPKTQFENAKTQKTAQVLAQVFLDRRSKKSPDYALTGCHYINFIHLKMMSLGTLEWNTTNVKNTSKYPVSVVPKVQAVGKRNAVYECMHVL